MFANNFIIAHRQGRLLEVVYDGKYNPRELELFAQNIELLQEPVVAEILRAAATALRATGETLEARA